jgi:hypothetical protein
LAVKTELDELSKKNIEIKGQIVLYEAWYKNKENKAFGALPTIIAAGIQSRLFYTKFLEAERYETKIYEWITAPRSNDYFIERSQKSLSVDAVKMQFNPIPAYWEQNRKRLPEDDEQLEEAYENFGLKKLFKEEEVVEWKIWSKPGK